MEGILTAMGVLSMTAWAGSREGAGKMTDAQDVPRLYRVILPVSGIDKAASFYAELFGMKGQRVSPGRHYFHCGATILAIVDPRADGDAWDARPNQDHVYFAVKDLQGVHKRAAKLGGLSKEMGKIEKRPWGEVSFYMTDPFGNPLCFVDEATLFTGRQK